LECQKPEFRPGELKHEIRGKALKVAFDGLVQVKGFNVIEFGEIAINHHPLAANQKDPLFNQLGGQKLLSGFGFGPASHSGFQIQMKLDTQGFPKGEPFSDIVSLPTLPFQKFDHTSNIQLATWRL
jgi:hypothetical protein